jgi:glycogen synthase
MVSETLPARQLGGLAKHAVTLANALIDQGHEVALMGLAGVDDEASMQETGFKGRFIGALRIMPGWKEGLLGCFNPIKRPHFARQMAQTILAHAQGFDVIHYHGNLPLVGAYIPQGVNFVQTRHDQGSECMIHVRFRGNQVCQEMAPEACAACATTQPNALQTMVTSYAVRRYREVAAQALSLHKTIFVSEAIRRNARRVLPEAAFAKSTVIHNFINQQRLATEVRVERPDTGGPWRVLIASRLDEAKGVGQFLDAWAPQRPEGVHLTVVGDGPLRASIERRHAGGWVSFMGHLPYSKTLQLTAQSHVAVVPSLWEESCATTILEALYLGLPCFALRRGGNPELAAYARWPSQLRLFDSTADLVEGLRTHVQGPVCLPDSGPNTGAAAASDVQAQLPHILQVYEAP